MPHPVLNIPAGAPFLENAASYFLSQHDEQSLQRAIFITSNQRMKRGLVQALQQQAGKKGLFSPMVMPIGQWQKNDLLTICQHVPQAVEEILQLLPPMSNMRRKSVLAMQIQAASGYFPAFGHLPRALKLAGAMMQVHDALLLQSADITELLEAQPLPSRRYGAVLQKLFAIMVEHWPAICEEAQAQSSVEYQLALQQILMRYLRPIMQTRAVYVLGSTGSAKSTRALLCAVAQQAQMAGAGGVLLPGAATDEESAKELRYLHLNRTVQAMQLPLAQAPYQPALKAAKHYKKIMARNSEEEAALAACLAKECLVQTPEERCLIVVPDRVLMRRIVAHLQSRGIFAEHPPLGSFLRHPFMCYLQGVLQLLQQSDDAWAMREVLSYFSARDEVLQDAFTQAVSLLDSSFLREKKSQHFFEALKPTPDQQRFMTQILAWQEALKQCAGNRLTAQQWVEEIREKFAEYCPDICPPDAPESLLSQLPEYDLLGAVPVKQAAVILHDLAKDQDWRDDAPHVHETRRNIMLLSPVEARLVQAENVILTGFHAGHWPSVAGPDSWISRPMRQKLGLPDESDDIAKSSHDLWLYQEMATRLYVLWAEVENGNKTQESPLLTQLPVCEEDGRYQDYMKAFFKAGPFAPLAPMPALPPQSARPKKLHVSSLNALLKDPYQLYAKSVLGLVTLKDYAQQAQKQDFGTIAHRIMQWVLEQEDTPTLASIMGFVERHLHALVLPHGVRLFWERQLREVAAYALEKRAACKARRVAPKVECKLSTSLTITPELRITLEGMVDLVELLPEGGARIVDYKTGAHATSKAIENGQDAQLMGYALLVALEMGKQPEALVYEKLPDVKNAAAQTKYSLKADVFEEAKQQLYALIATLHEADTPFWAHPLHELNIDSGDSSYDGVSRFDEWG